MRLHVPCIGVHINYIHTPILNYYVLFGVYMTSRDILRYHCGVFMISEDIKNLLTVFSVLLRWNTVILTSCPFEDAFAVVLLLQENAQISTNHLAVQEACFPSQYPVGLYPTTDDYSEQVKVIMVVIISKIWFLGLHAVIHRLNYATD